MAVANEQCFDHTVRIVQILAERPHRQRIRLPSGVARAWRAPGTHFATRPGAVLVLGERQLARHPRLERQSAWLSYTTGKVGRRPDRSGSGATGYKAAAAHQIDDTAVNGATESESLYKVGSLFQSSWPPELDPI
jgi:hypothetical protein